MQDPQHTLSISVLKRTLSPRQYEALMAEYRGARKSFGGGPVNRKDRLNEKVSPDEMALLEAYVNETETTLKELSAQFGISVSELYRSSCRTALNLFYQNQ